MPLPQEILDSIPEDYRENETLKKFDDVGALAKSYVEANSMLGRAIRIPGEDAGEDDRAKFLEKLINNAPELMMKPDLSERDQSEEFFTTLGKPLAPDEYTRPEDVKLDENVEAELRQVLHEANLTDAQFQKVIQQFSERESQRQEQMSLAQEESMGELKGKWGVTYEDRINAAQRMNEQFYPGRDFAEVSPKEMEALYNIHVAHTGKAAPAAHQQQANEGMTPQEAQEQADEIMRKVHDPKSNLSHEEKMRLINKRIDLLTRYAGFSRDVNDLRVSR